MDRQTLIAARIKQARESLNMSQDELGKLYGCSDAHISRIEKGNVKLGVADIERFATILGKPLAWFISDQATAHPRPPEAALPEIEMSLRSFVPVYGEVSAGEGMEPIDFVACSRLKPAADTIRAFRVKGLCLEPELHEGDTLIVDTALSPQDGDLVIVIVDGLASVKRFKDTGTDKWLENNHGRYKPEDVYQVGVVTEYNRKRR